jgi:hypothetical protein
MPTFQVECRELVYVDRLYEIEAESADAAWKAIEKSKGEAGIFLGEQMQDTHSFCGVERVHDENGNEEAADV